MSFSIYYPQNVYIYPSEVESKKKLQSKGRIKGKGNGRNINKSKSKSKMFVRGNLSQLMLTAFFISTYVNMFLIKFPPSLTSKFSLYVLA